MIKELQKRILTSIFVIPLFLFFIFKGSIYFIFFLIILYLISSYEWIKIARNIIFKLIGLIFLLQSFYFVYLFRVENFNTFLFVIVICISTDLGGYFFGKFIKGPKLTKISPNKTYSGLIGGFLLSICFSYLFSNKFDLNFVTKENNFNTYIYYFLILLTSFISQVGDLIISYFKRLSNIKDTGKIFPGHGGLLDRIDGMIFVFPSIYLILNLII